MHKSAQGSSDVAKVKADVRHRGEPLLLLQPAPSELGPKEGAPGRLSAPRRQGGAKTPLPRSGFWALPLPFPGSVTEARPWPQLLRKPFSGLDWPLGRPTHPGAQHPPGDRPGPSVLSPAWSGLRFPRASGARCCQKGLGWHPSLGTPAPWRPRARACGQWMEAGVVCVTDGRQLVLTVESPRASVPPSANWWS